MPDAAPPLALHAVRAVIFDLDGVVIDSEPLYEEAERRLFAAFGLDVPASVLQDIKGVTAREAFAYVLHRHGRDGVTVADLIAYKDRVFRDILQAVQPVPGAPAFIRQAADRYGRVGLTTSSPPATQQLAFDRFDLHACFDVVVTDRDVTRTKPDPEPYRITVARLGVPAAACLVVEDSTNGVRAAVGAGCLVAGLTTTFPAAALRAAGAHLVVDGFAALTRALGWGP